MEINIKPDYKTKKLGIFKYLYIIKMASDKVQDFPLQSDAFAKRIENTPLSINTLYSKKF